MVPVEISPLQVKALLTFNAGLKTLACGFKKNETIAVLEGGEKLWLGIWFTLHARSALKG